MSEVITDPSAFGVDMHQLIHGDTVGHEGAEHLTYSGLFARYADSIYGRSHALQPLRFAHTFKWGGMLDDLGDDIHPVRHMLYTETEMVRPLLAAQNASLGDVDEQFSPEEIAALRLAALVHDIGECEHPDLAEACGATVGDINFWDKTEEHETTEVKIREHVYGALYADVPNGLITFAEGIIAKPTESFAGAAFAAAERVGYFVTGINAAIKAIELEYTQNHGGDERRFTEAKRLAVEVGLRWYEPVKQLGERFPYAGHIAAEHQIVVQYVEEKFAA